MHPSSRFVEHQSLAEFVSALVRANVETFQMREHRRLEITSRRLDSPVRIERSDLRTIANLMSYNAAVHMKIGDVMYCAFGHFLREANELEIAGMTLPHDTDRLNIRSALATPGTSFIFQGDGLAIAPAILLPQDSK